MNQRTKRLFVTLAVFAVSAIAVFAGGCKTVAKWKDKFDQLRCKHEWRDGEVTKEATCEEDGELTVSCTKCEKEKVEVILAWGHSWNDGEVTKEPTCEEDGELTKVCLTCEATKTETIPATGHELSETVAILEPTCENKGYNVLECVNCDYVECDKLPATGHDWELDCIIREPTCIENGQGYYICTICETEQELEMSKTQHTDNDGDAVCDVCEETDLTEALTVSLYKITPGYYRVYREDVEFKIDLGEKTIDDFGTMVEFLATIPAKGNLSDATVEEFYHGYTQTVFDIYTYEDYVEIRMNENGGVYSDGILLHEISDTYTVSFSQYNIDRLYRIYELTANVETTE